ncbi:23S rRNA pseudouridine1911/1915/1917 synthase [Nitratiruptor sp. YY08-26]|uniref:RluA family pseudouridine synthase n=1 Tax=unclassified Nitratiruptor TaxID=2624044 RepID=UPI00191557C3|nr:MULTISPECIES: RluA family pseudouridine synthase [unclassified Nitratiruptor]BCD62102.1 23S rRNA pseudouridine1911/1915/1917 synthase [Nitratiruptor sp. YY08-13]BCD66038.1 23S rRNA pseudouridine1911/1915/1917 synthase [Nitratiruptor sp. YY08-26]
MDELHFEAQQKERLDKFLTQELQKSRNQIEQLIKGGFVTVDNQKITKTGYRLKEGDEIVVNLPKPRQSQRCDVDFEVDIVYEDEDILVVNKPSGIVVHPAPSVKEATLVDWLKSKGISLSTLSGEERHGIVHRIDKETSGLLVVAKNDQVHLALSQQLQDKSMGRYYLAIIEPPLKENIIVDKPIGRSPKNRLKMTIINSGRVARSAFVKILQSKNGVYELIGAKLFTGRTHQIRVHLASLQRHILGDSLYGFKSKKATIPRVFLHAYVLYLRHPKSNKEMRFVAPLPDDMQQFLQKNFEMENVYEKIIPETFDKLFDFSSGLWITAKTS